MNVRACAACDQRFCDDEYRRIGTSGELCDRLDLRLFNGAMAHTLKQWLRLWWRRQMGWCPWCNARLWIIYGPHPDGLQVCNACEWTGTKPLLKRQKLG